VFGLDEEIAELSSGGTVGVVILVAVLLGVRHATDPDHLAAVSTLIASERERSPHGAAALGFSWGLGHATTLSAFGLPIVLFRAYLPAPVQHGAELAIGLVIVALALRLLWRWRHGQFHAHEHEHEGVTHRHLHTHASRGDHSHDHVAGPGRSPLQAYGIGLMHGVGGSAGVGVLVLASIPNRGTGAAALLTFALFTAISMSIASTAFGYLITHGPVGRRSAALAPVLGSLSLAFGVWYGLAALTVVPYGS
jgi:ABC-type nickel/cobalt efflux system permease component RcnA